MDGNYANNETISTCQERCLNVGATCNCISIVTAKEIHHLTVANFKRMTKHSEHLRIEWITTFKHQFLFLCDYWTPKSTSMLKRRFTIFHS